jgi:hypothetical protein
LKRSYILDRPTIRVAIDERKKYVMDLGGQKSMTKHSNQPKVRGHNEGGKGDEEIRRGGDCGGRVIPSFWG